MGSRSKRTNKDSQKKPLCASTRSTQWHQIDYKKELQEFQEITQTIKDRIEGTDRFLKIVENTLAQHASMGDPLSLDPGSAGYEQVMELYLKILRAQKDLAEQFRKLKLTNMEFMDKQAKLDLRQVFLQSIQGMSLEEIREAALAGKFEPTNLVAANMLAEGALNDANIGNKTMISLSGWNMDVEPDNNIEPVLNITLSGKSNTDSIEPINAVKRIDNEQVETEECDNTNDNE